MKKLIAVIIPILIILNSCSYFKKEPSYKIYQIYDGQIDFSLVYNHRSELKDEIKTFISDSAPKERTITICGKIYNLTYIESESRSLADYKVDKYKVLDVDSIFKGLTPTIRFYSGTDKVASIFGFVNSSIGDISSMTDEALKNVVAEYLQPFVNTSNYNECMIEKPGSKENDLYKLKWLCKNESFELNDFIEVVIRDNGDIISSRIEGDGIFNDTDIGSLKIEEDICTKLINEKLYNIYGTSMNEYRIEKKTLYITKGGRFGIYYNVEVKVNSSEKTENCELFIYTDTNI